MTERTKLPWLRDGLAGTIAGLMAVIHSLAVGSILFGGLLSGHVAVAMTGVLVGSGVLFTLVAALGSYRYSTPVPSYVCAAILFPALATVAGAIQAKGNLGALVPSARVVVMIATVVAGAWMFFLGRTRKSRWVSFVPYPVVGGFLAGAGWLLLAGGIHIMVGPAVEATHGWLSAEAASRVWPGVALALSLFLATRITRHATVLPTICVIAAVVANLWFSWTAASGTYLSGWFLAPLEPDLTAIFDVATLGGADWSIVSSQLGTVIAIALIMPVIVILHCTAIDVSLDVDGNHDKELSAHGVGNMVAGMLSGTVGTVVSDQTVLTYRSGGRGPAVGYVAAAMCFAVVGFAGEYLNRVPLFVVGGLNFYLGFLLLRAWLFDSRRRMSWWDYGLVLTIVVVVAIFGFLAGVGAGLLIACVVFAVRYAQLEPVRFVSLRGDYQSNVERSPDEEGLLHGEESRILVIKLQGYIFFGTATSLLEKIRARIADEHGFPLMFAILDFRSVEGIDSSASRSLVKLRQVLERSGSELICAGASVAVTRSLEQHGLIGHDDQLLTFGDLDHAVEWCEERVLEIHGVVRDEQLSVLDELGAIVRHRVNPQDLLEYVEPVEVAKGGLIAQQGEPSDGMFFLIKGQVSVIAEVGSGQRIRLRTFRHRTILGEMGVYGKQVRSASLLADEDCSLLHLPIEQFALLKRERPDMAASLHEAVVAILSSRLRRTGNALTRAAAEPSETHRSPTAESSRR